MSGNQVTLPSHAKKHPVDSTIDHTPVPGVHNENDVVVMDANGLPVKDSGVQISTLAAGMHPKGEWDASGGTLPTPTNVGDFWWITIAGTMGGVDYEIGDWVVYVDDSPDTWAKIDNTETGKVKTISSDTPGGFLADKISGGETIDITQISVGPSVSLELKVRNWRADISLAGAEPVDSDLQIPSQDWEAGERGLGIGTTGRIFLMYNAGTQPSPSVKYVELS